MKLTGAALAAIRAALTEINAGHVTERDEAFNDIPGPANRDDARRPAVTP